MCKKHLAHEKKNKIPIIRAMQITIKIFPKNITEAHPKIPFDVITNTRIFIKWFGIFCNPTEKNKNGRDPS